MPKKPAKKAAKKSGAKSGQLQRQPHGGAIYLGSPPGGHPGAGAPPSELRRAMRGTLTDVLEEIEDIRTKREECPECGRKFTDRDVLALGDFLARYGLGARKDSGVPENLIRALAADVMAVVGDDQEVLREIHDRWVMTLGAHAVGEA